jgi:hypothetical protein
MKQKIPIIDIKKYGGQEVAIFKGNVISTGKSVPEVLKKLKKMRTVAPLREVTFLRVPESLIVIYYV